MNKKEAQIYHRNWQKQHKEKTNLKTRKWQLKTYYNLTLEEYDQLVIKQNGLCAFCGQPNSCQNIISGNIRRLAVDHNHKTGQVRALLCVGCNAYLGWYEIHKNRIKEYLEKYDGNLYKCRYTKNL